MKALYHWITLLGISLTLLCCNHTPELQDEESKSLLLPAENPIRINASAQEVIVRWEITHPQEGHRALLRKSDHTPWVHLLAPESETAYRILVDANSGPMREATLLLTYADCEALPLLLQQAAGEEPQPEPSTGIYRSGWAELPQEVDDPDRYYAHHITDLTMQGLLARNYTVCFSAQHHVPLWVAAPRHKAYEGESGRSEAYQHDPQIPINLQYQSKSTGGGCNKGHMLGSAERTASTKSNQQVFYYSNIAPQSIENFNTGGGAWNLLEDHVDRLVCADTTYVVIGCYFDTYTDKHGYTATPRKIEFGGRDDVSYPTMFYYALLRTRQGNSGKSVFACSREELQCVAFVRSHATPKKTAVDANDLCSIAELEALIGETLFANVPQAPKTTYDPSDWNL